jgi:Fic family protein
MEWLDFRINARLGHLKPSDIEIIYALIAQIDAVKNSWYLSEKLSPRAIERLTHSVIITSRGASNRIEGNYLSDEQVENLYNQVSIQDLKSRDEQEVVGYLQVLEFIFNHYQEFPLTEYSVLTVHRDMLNYVQKDMHHRGVYKTVSNRVEERDQRGKVVGVIFEPTPPYLVKKEIQELIYWFDWALQNSTKHPLIVIANFIFEFLVIHPFQDGNGRTSRLLTNLMFIKAGLSVYYSGIS